MRVHHSGGPPYLPNRDYKIAEQLSGANDAGKRKSFKNKEILIYLKKKRNQWQNAYGLRCRLQSRPPAGQGNFLLSLGKSSLFRLAAPRFPGLWVRSCARLFKTAHRYFSVPQRGTFAKLRPCIPLKVLGRKTFAPSARALRLFTAMCQNL